MLSTEQRLTALEEQFSHISLINEELSTELMHSYKRIEELERKVIRLESRFNNLEETIEAPPENTKPPHW